MILTLLLVTGALNPQVTQANIATTICARGWTTTVRPNRYVSARIKRQLIEVRGLDYHANVHRFTLDHKVPLEVGGAPNDRNNFMLQTIKAARAKDTDENRAHRLVCAGRWTLAQGQAVFLNWSRP